MATATDKDRDVAEYMGLVLEAADTGDWSKADAWIEKRLPGASRYFAMTRATTERDRKAGRQVMRALASLLDA